MRRSARNQLAYGTKFLVAALLSFGVYLLFSTPLHLPGSAAPQEPVRLDRETSNDPPPAVINIDVGALPDFEVGKTIEFGTDMDNHPLQSNRALLSGWSVPEPGGIWSLGKRAELGFVVHSAAGGDVQESATLLFEGIAFVAPGHEFQRIQAWVGNKLVDQVTLSSYFVSFAIALSGVKIKDGTQLVLSLSLPDAIVQGAVTKSNDPRQVAFRIKSLRLE